MHRNYSDIYLHIKQIKAKRISFVYLADVHCIDGARCCSIQSRIASMPSVFESAAYAIDAHKSDAYNEYERRKAKRSMESGRATSDGTIFRFSCDSTAISTIIVSWLWPNIEPAATGSQGCSPIDASGLSTRANARTKVAHAFLHAGSSVCITTHCSRWQSSCDHVSRKNSLFRKYSIDNKIFHIRSSNEFFIFDHNSCN